MSGLILRENMMRLVKLMIGLGLFAIVFSCVWITAIVNGFEFLQQSSSAFQSFSNTLYCGGEMMSITYGPSTPGSRSVQSGGRSFKAVCTDAKGTTTDITGNKTAIDLGVFFALMLGGIGLISWAIKRWIKIPVPAPAIAV
jgi:hypothetical protein